MKSLWVISSAFPCGARFLPPQVMGLARPGTSWLDVCILGNHLPQMYPQDDINSLTVDECARLGLCPVCLGFGDLSDKPIRTQLAAVRTQDEIEHLCQNCGGTGRPAMRIKIVREGGSVAEGGSVTATLMPLPHEFIPPIPEIGLDQQQLYGLVGACLGCGMPRDGKGPLGEELHP